MHTALAAALLASMLVVAAGEAIAQRPDVATIKPYTGTLQRIHETGIVRLGHRTASPPFAFLGADGRPIGYSLDLCAVVVEAIGRELRQELRTELRPVTPENRFEMITAGQIDLECGSTTANDARRSTVAFSPTSFVTGARMMTRRADRIGRFADLRGRTVVLTRGTVHAEVIPRLAQRRNLDIRFVDAADHDTSFGMVRDGRADAFVNDDIQLHGMLAERAGAADLEVVGEFLTYADYALMLRKDDPEFAAVVERAFAGLASSSEIRAIYRRWFQRPLPSGATLGIPMSPHLEHVFRLQGLAAD